MSIDERPPSAKQRKLHTFGFEALTEASPSRQLSMAVVPSAPHRPATHGMPATIVNMATPPSSAVRQERWRPNVTSQSLNMEIRPSREAEQGVSLASPSTYTEEESASQLTMPRSQPPLLRTTMCLTIDEIRRSMRDPLKMREWRTLDEQLDGDAHRRLQ